MAAFNRPTEATYTISENISVDTQDNEDHTFCGIMFPVKCKELLPLDHIVIKSVAVRGRLGPLTVWVSNPEERRNRNMPSNRHSILLDKQYWTKLYEKEHGSSRYDYKELKLDSPIRLSPGETRVVYIHSTLPGDEAIVYDTSQYSHSAKRYEDDKIVILSGRAHVSNDIFGQEPIWGWGNAWRDRREFVGRLNYGTVYKLWNPQMQPKFGGYFQDGARALFLCQRRWESPLSRLPDECIFYILNMCRWDWFNDDPNTMKERRTREKTRRLQEQQATESAKNEESNVASMPPANETAQECRPRRCKMDRIHPAKDSDNDDDDSDSDSEYEDDNQKVNAMETEGYVAMSEDDSDEDDDGDGDNSFFDLHANFDHSDENNDDDSDDDDDDDDDEDSDEEYHNYRANIDAFTFHEIDSDNEDEDSEIIEENARREYLRRQYARIHVLRALAAMEDGDVGHAW